MADSTRVEPAAGSTEAERRAKVERLRAEGIDPYPFSFPDRTSVATILEAHDPEQLGRGRAPRLQLPDRRPHRRPARPRQDALLRRSRPHRDDPGLRSCRRARSGGLRPDRGPRHRRPRRGRGRPLRDQARPAGDRGARVRAARQGAARPSRPLPRHLRPGGSLPAARARPDGERALARDLRDAGQGRGGDPRVPQRARLRRDGNAGAAADDRWRRGATLQDPSPRARPPPLPADRHRAVPEAGDRRRLRERLRAGQVLPQRGDVAAAQPRVHDARVVRQRRRLPRRDGRRRGGRLRRRRKGAGDDQGRARRRDDRPGAALAANARCATRCSRRPASTSPRRAATSWPRSPARMPSPTTTGRRWSTPCRAS